MISASSKSLRRKLLAAGGLRLKAPGHREEVTFIGYRPWAPGAAEGCGPGTKKSAGIGILKATLIVGELSLLPVE
jgi:hypothetical protein